MKRRSGAIALTIVVLLGCSACAPTAAEQGGLSLADTKSPVQLLRNESILRLPADEVASVSNTDGSEACDGDETLRSWRSSAIITLGAAAGADPDAAMATLASSFEEDGWVVSPGNEREADEQAVLTSGTSAAEIRLIATKASGGGDATITIEAAGPCVQTDGPDSDEVRRLEGDG